MKVYTQHTEREVRNIAIAIARDPYSWSKWLAMHIKVSIDDQDTQEYPVVSQEIVKFTLNDALHDVDGSAYLLADGDILLMARNITPDMLEELGKALLRLYNTCSEAETHFQVYPLRKHWKIVQYICEDKASTIDIDTVNPPYYSSIFEDSAELFSLCEMMKTRNSEQHRSPKQVLLVEDDRLARKMVSKLLKDDYRLLTAEDAQDALIHYVLHSPDIVFLDIGLPDCDGKELLSTIMEHDPDANIVMFSGNGYMENVVESLSIGAKGFVSKPFRKEELKHYIEQSA